MIEIASLKERELLVCKIPVRLDVQAVTELEKELHLDGVRELVLDFSACTYVSSAGIRAILKAYQVMTRSKGAMFSRNVGRDIYEVFETTGLAQIIGVEKAIREITLDGLELISAGVCGECYRIDHETVLKLYLEGVDPSVAEMEKRYAKAAFIMGVPTAVSYDLVRCGNRAGVIYEMLNAELFSALIRQEPESLERHGQVLVRVAHILHGAKGDPSILPNMKERLRGYIRQMDEYLTQAEVEMLLRKLETVPDADTCVHFDLHTSNIMMQGHEPVVIDMGDLSIGNRLFDIGWLYMIYGIPETGLCMMATKIPNEIGYKFWNVLEDAFFPDKKSQEYRYFEENRYFLASLRVIYGMVFLPKVREVSLRWLRELLLPRISEAGQVS